MRDTWSVLARWLPAIGLSLGMALGAGCISGAAETPDDSSATAAPPSGQTVKFHVVLGDGPFKGTYDVAAEVCLAGVMKAGSWHATWEDEMSAKNKLTAVIVGFNPKPTFGNGISMMVNFGDEEDKILYEVQKPDLHGRRPGADRHADLQGQGTRRVLQGRHVCRRRPGGDHRRVREGAAGLTAGFRM